ncbi:hypothetical protein J2W88_000979 [Acidovorax delafieldii]|uniref:Uncharacterized protein n=1 Tax=Acidovorax delafieldii TaxID=47920 RepID=A0AAJ2EZL4_ACIDE|nr:hypothetical protein [Acidovorax delafieldii]MDR6836158.1 hypothetical protein [Acidovorax delafieldii]MDR7364871.1 hypothetical protein [Acidovorax delafieldii]
MRVTFFCFAKRKSPKKRRPPVCDPFAVRRGKPASGRLRGAPWNSLRCVAASFRHPRRVSSRSMGASTPMLTPQPPRRRRSQQGLDSRTANIHSGHCFARLRLRSAWRLRPRVGAERSAAKQRPVWMFCPFCPSGCAEERRVWRIRARDCLSEVKRSEFERDPAKPEHHRLPRSEAQGTQTVGSPFLWSLSFGDAKERDSHAGRLPASALKPGTAPASSASSNNLSHVLPDVEKMLLKE